MRTHLHCKIFSSAALMLCIALGLGGSVRVDAEKLNGSTVAKDSLRTRSESKSDSLKHYRSSTVVVTGTRSLTEQDESAVKIDVVDRTSIRANGTPSLAGVLQQQVGVGISQSLHPGVQLMGLGPDYTQILIDGMPLISRVAGVIDLSRISVANVEQVEIVKGPMSSLYGSEALAGVINLISIRAQEGWTTSSAIQYTQLQGEDMHLRVAHGGDDIDWSTFIDFKNSPEFSLTQGGLNVPYSGFRDITAQVGIKARLYQHLAARLNARLFTSHSFGNFIESYFGQIAANAGSVNQLDEGVQCALDYVANNSKLSFQTYVSHYSEQYQFDVRQGSGSSVDDLYRTLIRPSLQYDYSWNSTNRLTLGCEWSSDQVDGTRYPSIPKYRTLVGYAQWETKLSDNLGAVLSTRLDQNSDYGSAISPKLSMLYRLDENMGFRASLGSGFKAPDFRQLSVEFRNNLQGANYILVGARLLGKDLLAERSLSADVSWYLNSQSVKIANQDLQFRCDARVFINSLHNLIEYYLDHFDNRIAVYSYHNLTRIRTQGLELNLSMGMKLSESDSLAARAGYQALMAVDDDVLDAVKNGSAGSVDPKTGSFVPLTTSSYGGLWFRSNNLWNLCMSYNNNSGWMLQGRADYVGRFGDEALDKNGSVLGTIVRPVPDRDDEYVKGYWNMQFVVSKRIYPDPQFLRLQEMKLSLGVSNILNELRLQSVPTLLGRQIFVELSCQW